MRNIFNFFRRYFNMLLVKEKNPKLDIANIRPEWEELCEECSTAAKKHRVTKEDSRKILKEIRKKYEL